MYIFVNYFMSFTLCISVVEMNAFGSTIKNNYQTNSDYQPLLEINNNSTQLTKGESFEIECELN